MNSFERIWAALNLEEPDRIPTHTINIDGNVADQVLGKPDRTAFDVFDEMAAQYPDTKHILINASKDEVIDAVKDAIKAMGYGGGYMLSPANFHPQISIENLKWMIEATIEFGKYPLQI